MQEPSLPDISPQGPRVERLKTADGIFWVKRPERLPLRMRMQKGDPLRAFADERKAWKRLSREGAPLPKMVAEGPGFFVTRDAGELILRRLRRASDAEATRMVTEAARALGQMHAKGLVHGRPAIKDICWQDGRVAFIDVERAERAARSRKGRALDVIAFFASLVVEGVEPDAIEAARKVYVETAGPTGWREAQRYLARRRWIAAILAPILPFLRNKGEFAAIRPLMALFAR